MQDTPEHIKKIQLDIWMSKTISERLERTILDNDALFKLWKEMRQQMAANDNSSADLFNHNLRFKK